MVYDLQAIADYAGKVAQLTDTKFTTENHWINQQQEVQRFAAALERNSSKSNLANYAAALHNAAAYLIWRRSEDRREVASDRQRFIEQHFEVLKNAYRQHYSGQEIKAPRPLMVPTALQSSSRQGLLGNTRALSAQRHQEQLRRDGLQHAPALNDFLASNQFRALEEYLNNTLTDDSRSHSYLCGLIDLHEGKKADVLQQLIVDIKSQPSMDEVKGLLRQFYREKDMALSSDKGVTWHKSRFDILNTGQNITTRFFSMFGKQTTTINLIDSLAVSIGFDPQLSAEISQNPSNS